MLYVTSTILNAFSLFVISWSERLDASGDKDEFTSIKNNLTAF